MCFARTHKHREREREREKDYEQMETGVVVTVTSIFVSDALRHELASFSVLPLCKYALVGWVALCSVLGFDFTFLGFWVFALLFTLIMAMARIPGLRRMCQLAMGRIRRHNKSQQRARATRAEVSED